MDSWTFDWSAVAAIGQVLGAFATAVAVWVALKPFRKRVHLDLVYVNREGKKVETLRIYNESTRAINIDRLGVIIKRNFLMKQRLNFDSNGYWLNELPITLTHGQSIIISEVTDDNEHTSVYDFSEMLQSLFFESRNPSLKKSSPNSKIILYAIDNLDKVYKTYIGRKKNVVNIPINEQINLTTVRQKDV